MGAARVGPQARAEHLARMREPVVGRCDVFIPGHANHRLLSRPPRGGRQPFLPETTTKERDRGLLRAVER